MDVYALEMLIAGGHFLKPNHLRWSESACDLTSSLKEASLPSFLTMKLNRHQSPTLSTLPRVPWHASMPSFLCY